MARRKRRPIRFRSYLLRAIPTLGRSARRGNSKYRRSHNYWQQHSDVMFSRTFLYDVEKLWFEFNTPTANIEFKQVDKPERFPRYRAGLWDGMAYFVTFTSANDVSKFKVALWNRSNKATATVPK